MSLPVSNEQLFMILFPNTDTKATALSFWYLEVINNCFKGWLSNHPLDNCADLKLHDYIYAD